MNSAEINDKTDYYELLGVEEDASQDALKRAYRKAAMKWHPDRNHDNTQEATRVFQIIEHAYSILSDPHERAWYDGHRNAVVNDLGEFSATNVDIDGYFSASAYSGFSDGPRGFYTVFRNAFDSLSQEEKTKAPSFGDSTSPYEDVNAFYSYWTCFTTKRSFAFEDIYRLKDAPNGRYKRAMNKENEKVRQKAQREFVASVRELALFAKKRDPRVQKHLEELEKINEEKKALAEKKKLERQKEIEEQLRQIEEEKDQTQYRAQDFIYLKEFAKNEPEPEWHCEYCGRDMNTETAFTQHCRTKKHKKMTTAARRDFLMDPSLFEHTMYTFTLLGLSEDEIEDITGQTIEELEPLSNKKDKAKPKIKRGMLDDKAEPPPSLNAKRAPKVEEEEEEIAEKEETNVEVEEKGKKNQKQKGKNVVQKGKSGKQTKGQQQQNQQQKQPQKPQLSKKERHKQMLQKKKEEKEKAEKEEIEKLKGRDKSREFNDDDDDENEINNAEDKSNKEEKPNQNNGPKLSKKEKKRQKQLEEARLRLLIQAMEEDEDSHKEFKDEEIQENEQSEVKSTENEIKTDETKEITETQENKETKENKEAQENKETKENKETQENKEINENNETQENKESNETNENNENNVKNLENNVMINENDDSAVNANNNEKIENNENDNNQEHDQNQNQGNYKNQQQQQNQKGGKQKKQKLPKKAPPGQFMCRKCRSVFPSKTKLFKHLEETKHATAY